MGNSRGLKPTLEGRNSQKRIPLFPIQDEMDHQANGCDQNDLTVDGAKEMDIVTNSVER